jgi:hypothetical protein
MHDWPEAFTIGGVIAAFVVWCTYTIIWMWS